MSRPLAKVWFQHLALAMQNTVITERINSGIASIAALDMEAGVNRLRFLMRDRMTYLIGNGGSLAIAAHMATDFNLAGLRAMALVDPIALTSHSNDFGVEAAFTKQIEMAPRHMGDVLIAMSCSGKSPNILDACKYANACGMEVVTLTGFEHDNPLRSEGTLSFYVPTHHYGWVQLAHEAILHCACDIEAGHAEPGHKG